MIFFRKEHFVSFRWNTGISKEAWPLQRIKNYEDMKWFHELISQSTFFQSRYLISFAFFNTTAQLNLLMKIKDVLKFDLDFPSINRDN